MLQSPPTFQLLSKMEKKRLVIDGKGGGSENQKKKFKHEV